MNVQPGRVNRLPPRLSPHLYKSFELIAPPSTHTRPARCEEVECEAHANGWRTAVDVTTPLGVRQANYIYQKSARHFTYEPGEGAVTFTFPAGQQCFAQHRVRLEREPLYVVRNGWAREPSEPLRDYRTHHRGEFWVDEFQESTGQIADARERG